MQQCCIVYGGLKIHILHLIGATPYGLAHFGQGSGLIVMDEVQCAGNETSIRDCQHITNHNCFSGEDSGVVCKDAECTDWEVRLVNGFTENEGRLEVCRYNIWGTVCNSEQASMARVVCRQLGLPYTGESECTSKHVNV